MEEKTLLTLLYETPWQITFGSAFVALIPVVVWTKFFAKAEHQMKWIITAFLLGTITVPLLLFFYRLIELYPVLNYYQILGKLMVEPYFAVLGNISVDDPTYAFHLNVFERAQAIYETLTIVIDALLEEIIKLSLLICFLRVTKLVHTIGDAIIYSVLAGLGFAYIENVIYFVRGYNENEFNIFINVMIFRTIVLSIGHMAFSGIFGYFYGLSKFGLPVYEEQKWEGKHLFISRAFAKLFHIPVYTIFSVVIFLEGMFLAMLTHATFNSFLGFGLRDYAVYLVAVCGIYLYYLTQRKAGHLVLASLGKRKMSLMAPKDEDVVLELAGMWIHEGKYKEVEEMCDRLKAKDPDNAVITLLYARAHDKRRVKRAKLAFASLFLQEDIFEEDVSIFEKWKQIRAKKEEK